MEFGTYVSGLITGLREGVEAALIVSIILSYLARTGHREAFPRVLLGAGAAIVVSAILGVILFETVGEMPSPYEQIFEGGALILAASVVTWMLFWMRRQASAVKGELQARVSRALTEGGVVGLVILAFTAVVREGLETSLFLVGQVTAAGQGSSSGGLGVVLGAITGLLIATAIGYGFYRGSHRLNLAVFFRWTGIVLVFIAGGLLARAVHEFVEIGVLTIGTQPAYDISGVLSHDSGVGQFLAALFGYSSRPEVTRVVVHVAYLVVVLSLYLRPMAPRPAAPRPTEVAARP
ncbi:MAG TPA: iron uptake transporter permease EfeU [Candidatus Saccharimonadales bacterium]|nr:iron uptake transporter permease EfeU [Candidatus Saccharimonadales bacterium]